MEDTRLRGLVLTLGLALLVATAGCSSLGLGGDGGSGGDGAAGDGYSASGSELDGATLSDATAAAVQSAGSYTLNQSSSIVATQQGTEFTTEAELRTKVNFDAERGLREQQQRRSGGEQSREITSTVYTDGNTSYRQQEGGGNTSYDMQEGGASGISGINAVNVTGFNQNFTPIIDGLGWERTGSEEVDGVAVTRYDVTGIENESALGLGGSTTLTNVNGSMFVDGDGVTRQISLEYDAESGGSTSTLEVTITVSELGSTTVEEPDWVSKAQS
jgi:hypothetical protein